MEQQRRILGRLANMLQDESPEALPTRFNRVLRVAFDFRQPAFELRLEKMEDGKCCNSITRIVQVFQCEPRSSRVAPRQTQRFARRTILATAGPLFALSRQPPLEGILKDEETLGMVCKDAVLWRGMCVLFLFCGLGAKHVTPNFEVEAPTAAIAEKVALTAEPLSRRIGESMARIHAAQLVQALPGPCPSRPNWSRWGDDILLRRRRSLRLGHDRPRLAGADSRFRHPARSQPHDLRLSFPSPAAALGRRSAPRRLPKRILNAVGNRSSPKKSCPPNAAFRFENC